MYFIEPNALNCTGLAVSVRITALPTSSLWARANSPRIVHARSFTAGMMLFHKSGGSFGGGLSLKDVEVVTSGRQRYVDGTSSHALEIVSGAEMPVVPAAFSCEALATHVIKLSFAATDGFMASLGVCLPPRAPPEPVG